MLGSGAIVIMDDTTDAVKACLRIVRFFARESCGKCAPCREGTSWEEKILQRILDGNGRPGDIDLLLWPVHFTLAYVGFDVLRPHVAYGVEAGLRYSDPEVIQDRLQAIRRNYVHRLQTIENEETIPCIRRSEGRGRPDRPRRRCLQPLYPTAGTPGARLGLRGNGS